MKRRRKKKSFFTKQRVIILASALGGILLISALAIGLSGFFSSSERDVDELVAVEKGSGKINILLVGTDKKASLTDTILLASYNLDEDKVDILSIPRDTRMYIGTRYQKINSAYNISKKGKKNGINGTIEAVSRLTGVPINYYVEFTLSAFRDTIDALDGVYFDVPQNMNYDDPEQGLSIHLNKGYQLLDGKKAEQLVRFRLYPMGDIDRTKVQQAFIKAVADQKLNLSIVENIPDLYKTIDKNINTNFTISEVIKYAKNLSDLKPENVNMHSLPGIANNIDYGASYWIPDMDAVKKLVNEVFGYDAKNATVHSVDGASASKDKKVESSEPAKSDEPKKEQTESSKGSDEQVKEPKASEKPKESEEPKQSPKPTEESEEPKQTATATPKETSTPKATKTPMPTAKPVTTTKPTTTLGPTPTPKTNPAQKPTEPPAENGIKRPAAN